MKFRSWIRYETYDQRGQFALSRNIMPIVVQSSNGSELMSVLMKETYSASPGMSVSVSIS